MACIKTIKMPVLILAMTSLLISPVFNSETQFSIGALFTKKNTFTELAFKYAVQIKNIYRGDGIYYKPNIKIIPDNNIFSASKIVCNMTQKSPGIISIFGPDVLQVVPITESICKKTEIPHFLMNWQPSSYYLPPPTSINFFPHNVLLAEGLATIVRHMNWKSYAVVYQRNEALARLQGILRIPGVSDNPVTVRQLDSGTNYRSVFKALRNSGVLKIILDCDIGDTITILQQAKDVDLLSYPTCFLLVSLDSHTLDFSPLNTTANITLIRLFDPSNPKLLRNIQNWEIGEMRNYKKLIINPTQLRTETVLMIDAVNLLIESVNRLHIVQPIIPLPMNCDENNTWFHGYRIASSMKKYPLDDPISGLMGFDDFGQRVNFTLQVLELNNNKVKATWSPSNGTKLHITISAKERQQSVLKSLHRQQIIVSSKIVPPYLMHCNTSDPGDKNCDKFKGYARDLIEEIAQKLNFTYKFYLTPSNQNGNFDEKAQAWTGVIGDILSGKAQLGICDLTVTQQRRSVVDFSSHFMTLGISILYKKPPVGAANMFAFMGPLSDDVWMYTATAFLGVSVLLYLIARMAPGDWENPHPCDEHPTELENIWNLGNSLWLMMGSIMTQGCDILPKGISSRMAVAMWWFFSLLITSSYTANLSAYLAKGRMGSPINNVEDLLKQNRIKFGTMLNGTTYDFFRTSNYSTYQAVWERMKNFKPSTFVKENNEGVRRVLSKNQEYAFFMESSSMQYEINKHCELKEIGHRLDSKGYGIAMPMDAPYRTEINNVILGLQETGILQIMKDKWWKELNKGEECEDIDLEPDNGSLKLENVGGVFLVLGVGVAISFFIAISEFLWNVRNVAIQERITYWRALKLELKFAVNIWVTKKVVNVDVGEAFTLSESCEIHSIHENGRISPSRNSMHLRLADVSNASNRFE